MGNSWSELSRFQRIGLGVSFMVGGIFGPTVTRHIAAASTDDPDIRDGIKTKPSLKESILGAFTYESDKSPKETRRVGSVDTVEDGIEAKRTPHRLSYQETEARRKRYKDLEKRFEAEQSKAKKS